MARSTNGVLLVLREWIVWAGPHKWRVGVATFNDAGRVQPAYRQCKPLLIRALRVSARALNLCLGPCAYHSQPATDSGSGQPVGPALSVPWGGASRYVGRFGTSRWAERIS